VDSTLIIIDFKPFVMNGGGGLFDVLFTGAEIACFACVRDDRELPDPETEY
jgi:hypothetical protein